MKLGNAKFLLAGGPMPTAPQQGGDPTAMLLQAAQQAVQGQDCETAMQVCQMLIEALGGNVQEPAPQEAAPAPQLGEPYYKMGGNLIGRIKA